MLEILFWVAVGIIIGWHWPQPSWAKLLQDKVIKWWRDLRK